MSRPPRLFSALAAQMSTFKRRQVGFGFVDHGDITQAFPQLFFSRPAELVAPDLIGCRLVKRQDDGCLLWGVIVETEAYSCLLYTSPSPRDGLQAMKPFLVRQGVFMCM